MRIDAVSGLQVFISCVAELQQSMAPARAMGYQQADQGYAQGNSMPGRCHCSPLHRLGTCTLSQLGADQQAFCNFLAISLASTPAHTASQHLLTLLLPRLLQVPQEPI